MMNLEMPAEFDADFPDYFFDPEFELPDPDHETDLYRESLVMEW